MALVRPNAVARLWMTAFGAQRKLGCEVRSFRFCPGAAIRSGRTNCRVGVETGPLLDRSLSNTQAAPIPALRQSYFFQLRDFIRRAILCLAEEDLRDLMRPNARAGNARIIGQHDDRPPGIETTDDVVVVAEAAAMCDVALTGAAERKQLRALGGAQVRKDIREPAEVIVNRCAVVGCARGKGLLQRSLRDKLFRIQSLIPEK